MKYLYDTNIFIDYLANDSFEVMAMGVARSLLKLTVGGGCMLGGMVFPPLLSGEGIAWGVVLATVEPASRLLPRVIKMKLGKTDSFKVYTGANQDVKDV